MSAFLRELRESKRHDCCLICDNPLPAKRGNRRLVHSGDCKREYQRLLWHEWASHKHGQRTLLMQVARLERKVQVLVSRVCRRLKVPNV